MPTVLNLAISYYHTGYEPNGIYISYCWNEWWPDPHLNVKVSIRALVCTQHVEPDYIRIPQAISSIAVIGLTVEMKASQTLNFSV